MTESSAHPSSNPLIHPSFSRREAEPTLETDPEAEAETDLETNADFPAATLMESGESAASGNEFRVPHWALTLATLALLSMLCGWTYWKNRRAHELWDEAQRAAHEYNWNRAEAALAARLWYVKEDEEFLRLRLFVAVHRGDKPMIQALIKLIPNYAADLSAAYHKLGSLRLLASRYREAEEAFRTCLYYDPLNQGAQTGLLSILAIEDRLSEFDERTRWILDSATTPELLRLQVLRLAAHGIPIAPRGQLGRRLDEIEALKRASELDPDSVRLRAALAERFRRNQDWDKAKEILQSYAQASLDDPKGDPHAGLVWTRCLVEAPDPDLKSVESCLAKLEPRCGSHPWFWLAKGEWLHRRNDPQAIAAYRRAADLMPGSQEVRQRYADALRGVNQHQEAETQKACADAIAQLIELVGIHMIQDINDDRVLKAAELCRTLGREREAKLWRAMKGQLVLNSSMLGPMGPPRGR